MSYSLFPAAVAALIIASLPVAQAETVCEKDVFGKEHCRSGVASPTVRIVVGVVILVLVFLFIGIAALIKNRRNKKAAAASAAITGPSMSYMPSSYDPNAPQYPAPTATNAQGYPFNGYGAGGPIQGPAPTYAPPQGPPPV